MKQFLDQNDLRRLVSRIKETFKKYYTKEEVTKLGEDITYYFNHKLDVDYYNAPQIDNKLTLKADKTELSTVESIARGRATGYVFDTVEDMNAWLTNSENTEKLVLGDNLYIRATDVPDYWWDGITAQPLETQKVDLTEYAKSSEIEALETAMEQALDESIALCDSYISWEVGV